MRIHNFILAILIMSLVSGSIENAGTFKQNGCINLPQTCTSCTYNNISSIINPNGTFALVGNYPMTKNGISYNYTFCNTSILGTYTVSGSGDLDGLGQVWSYYFLITPNGSPTPSGVIVVLFIVFFLILVGLTCYLALYTIGHLMSLDFDLIDLAFDWGIYFVFIAFYFLEKTYLGNLQMETYLDWFVSIGGILFILLPIIAFAMSITIGSLNKKNFQAMNAPARIKFRRTR